MDPLEGLVHNFVTTLTNYTLAAIHYEKQEPQDSMGTYYEEKALHEATQALVNGVVGAIKEVK